MTDRDFRAETEEDISRYHDPRVHVPFGPRQFPKYLLYDFPKRKYYWANDIVVDMLDEIDQLRARIAEMEENQRSRYYWKED
jgi:hypothetical protein